MYLIINLAVDELGLGLGLKYYHETAVDEMDSDITSHNSRLYIEREGGSNHLSKSIL